MYVSERVVGQWLANVLPMSNGARWHRTGATWGPSGGAKPVPLGARKWWRQTGATVSFLPLRECVRKRVVFFWGARVVGQRLANVWPMSNGARWHKPGATWGPKMVASNRCRRFLPSPPQGMRKKTSCVFLGGVGGAPSWQKKTQHHVDVKKVGLQKKTQCFLRPQMVFGGNRLGLATTSVRAAAVLFFLYFFFTITRHTSPLLFCSLFFVFFFL